MTFGHGDTKILERIALALEEQNKLIKTQNTILDEINREITDLQGDDYSLESITRAILNR